MISKDYYRTQIKHLFLKFNRNEEGRLHINNYAINVMRSFQNDIKSLSIYFTGTNPEEFWNHKLLQEIIETTEDFPFLKIIFLDRNLN